MLLFIYILFYYNIKNKKKFSEQTSGDTAVKN